MAYNIESVSVYETEQRIYITGKAYFPQGAGSLAAGGEEPRHEAAPLSSEGHGGGRSRDSFQSGQNHDGIVERWKILKLDRCADKELNIVEDEKLYTKQELEQTLMLLHQGTLLLMDGCRILFVSIYCTYSLSNFDSIEKTYFRSVID